MSTNREPTGDTLFIPPLVLRGPRAAQLIQLEGQLSRLHAIRRRLAQQDVAPVAHVHAGAENALPKNWFFAGTAIVLVLALLTLGGWVTRDERPTIGSTVADVVRATR